MCGISGMIGSGWRPAQLQAMVAGQTHRGPDDAGTYINRTQQAGLGHNRLSIIDLSPAGHQPMPDHTGQRWLIFNGEIYNYIELRRELADYPYRSQTDTEVILAAYERWGDGCVAHFNGMFAFAIWDESANRLFCARDRLGIKPFYYAWHGDTYLFASEIKAILAAGFPPQPNWLTWGDYLNHGYYDHGNETFFAGVCSLPPGHTLSLTKGRLQISCYWDLPAQTADPLQLSDDEAAGRLRELLADAVNLRLRSDVPLGVNLSGGLDSASLMVTVDRLLAAEGEVQTFTASFADPQYDEQTFASNVPRQTKWVRHRQRLPETAVWPLIQKAMWHQEAPFGGVATLAYHHLHQLARERGVIVLLEGQGVDEMLAGYNYFRPPYYLDLLARGQWQTLRRELRASQLNGHLGLDGVRRLQAGAPLNVYQDGTSHLRPNCVAPELRAEFSQSPQFAQPYADHLTNALYRDLRHTKLPRVLRMNDHLSMAFGRELREPYLDHRIVEFLFRLPSHQKIRLGQSKYLLRHAMKPYLPDAVRLTGKRAVVTPQREWLRTIFRPQIEAIISSPSFTQRGLFDVSQVRREYEQFCRGQGQNAFFVWQWVNAEFWFRQFID